MKLLAVLLLVSCVGVLGYYDFTDEPIMTAIDPFDIMGAANLGLGGYGGFGGIGAGNLLMEQQPVLMQQQQQQFPVMQASGGKKVRYNQPTVTYAQPIVQKLNMQQPVIQQQKKTAQPIIQSDFRVAPQQMTAAISATAPTIQKGFGTGLGLGLGSIGNQQQFGQQFTQGNVNLGMGGFNQQQQQQQQQGLGNIGGEEEEQF